MVFDGNHPAFFTESSISSLLTSGHLVRMLRTCGGEMWKKCFRYASQIYNKCNEIILGHRVFFTFFHTFYRIFAGKPPFKARKKATHSRLLF